jgi:hypothetical protein
MSQQTIYFTYAHSSGGVQTRRVLTLPDGRLDFHAVFETISAAKPAGFSVGAVFINDEPLVPGRPVVNSSSLSNPFMVYDRSQAESMLSKAEAGSDSEFKTVTFHEFGSSGITVDVPLFVTNTQYYDYLEEILGLPVLEITRQGKKYTRNDSRILLMHLKNAGDEDLRQNFGIQTRPVVMPAMAAASSSRPYVSPFPRPAPPLYAASVSVAELPSKDEKSKRVTFTFISPHHSGYKSQVVDVPLFDTNDEYYDYLEKVFQMPIASISYNGGLIRKFKRDAGISLQYALNMASAEDLRDYFRIEWLE